MVVASNRHVDSAKAVRSMFKTPFPEAGLPGNSFTILALVRLRISYPKDVLERVFDRFNSIINRVRTILDIEILRYLFRKGL